MHYRGEYRCCACGVRIVTCGPHLVGGSVAAAALLNRARVAWLPASPLAKRRDA